MRPNPLVAGQYDVIDPDSGRRKAIVRENPWLPQKDVYGTDSGRREQIIRPNPFLTDQLDVLDAD